MMQEFTLNKQSWHFWLANFGRTRMGSYEQKYGTDICYYIRSIFKGLFFFTIVAFTCIAAAFWVGNSIYDIAQFFINGIEMSEPTKFLIILVGASTAILIFMLSVYGAFKGTTKLIQNRRDRLYDQGIRPNEPGFLTLAYRKFKEKSCFKINFKD